MKDKLLAAAVCLALGSAAFAADGSVSFDKKGSLAQIVSRNRRLFDKVRNRP